MCYSFIAGLDRYYVTALAETATRRDIRALKGVLYRHISAKAEIGAKLPVIHHPFYSKSEPLCLC